MLSLFSRSETLSSHTYSLRSWLPMIWNGCHFPRPTHTNQRWQLRQYLVRMNLRRFTKRWSKHIKFLAQVRFLIVRKPYFNLFGRPKSMGWLPYSAPTILKLFNWVGFLERRYHISCVSSLHSPLWNRGLTKTDLREVLKQRTLVKLNIQLSHFRVCFTTNREICCFGNKWEK